MKTLFVFFALLTSISWGQETVKEYHENGFISEITSTSKSGIISSVRYSDSIEGCPISGENQYEVTYIFENCRMVSKESNDISWGLSLEMPVQIRIPYCIETGQFQNYILNNGTMNYYSKSKELITTVKVVSGRRVNDPIVYFKDTILKREILKYNRHIDMNHNGQIEVSEASVASLIYMKDGRGISSLLGFSYFKRLESIEIHHSKIDPKLYKTDKELLAIIDRKSRPKGPGPDPRMPPPPPHPPIPKGQQNFEEIYDFTDAEASFPGGKTEMDKWVAQNLEYPATSLELEDQGRVFLSFVVETDGTITNVIVERGVTKELDRAAKRCIRSMPTWTPGVLLGKKVRTRIRVPVIFHME